MSTLHVNASISVEIIPLQELAKHNTKTDAWISIRGRVYDISWYISQHPGGVDPLLAYIGKDGTKAFNSIHSYVDFASILKGHEKGILEGHSLRTKEATAATSFSELVLEDDPPPTKTCCGCIHRRDRRMPKISFFNSPAAIAYEVKFKRNPLVPPSQEEDWCVGLDEEDNVFTVKKYLDDTNIWMASYKIDNPISYAFIQCVFRDSYDTCEITMKKKEEGVVWRRLGTPMPRSHVIIPNSSLNDSYDASIVYKEKVARDVNIYGIRFRRCVHFGIRLGHHMKIQLEGKENIIRL
ncbi:cytochrome b5 reductase 4 [Folsomia candida]|uniref:cytochrome b5 reductase 4 n=1 Tax=Folsomia candida TaxID=158441 RepID=UPI000B8F00B9|nr:cytochrome b5 reductase 4 [Folsomia candida]